jgi:glucokinase
LAALEFAHFHLRRIARFMPSSGTPARASKSKPPSRIRRGAARSSNSRPAGDGVWVGFDLGGTKMLAVVYDERFQPLARIRKKTKAHEGVKPGIDRIIEMIRAALEEAAVTPDRVKGVGIGCPGPLDVKRGVILDAPNLGWRQVPLRAVLGKALAVPVVVANDVDAGVYGEYRFGAAKDARCVVGIFPGTGVGGGMVLDGRIYTGTTRTCVEVGHIQVKPGGALCGCGHHGCLETVASRLAVAAAAAQAAQRGQAPNLMKAAGTDLAEIRSGVLAEAIQAGDAVVERIVRESAEHIGTAVASVVHLLAPDVVVLGGGLVGAMPKLYVDTVTQAAQSRVLPAYAGTFRVVAAALDDDATALGAAAWARENVGQQAEAS